MSNIIKQIDMYKWMNSTSMPITIVTDRDKGLLSAQEVIFPDSYKRFCARHLLGNIPAPAFDGQTTRRRE
jgi:hypothetical protein